MEKLNFKDFDINWNEDYYCDTNGRLDFYLTCANDTPLEIIDKYRASLGFTDSPNPRLNKVYYNIYLTYNLNTDIAKIEVIVNHSEKDDYAQYDFDVEISDTDLKKILARLLLMQI